MSDPTGADGPAQPKPKRPAPASERVEQAVSAPAQVAKPRGTDAVARAKVEVHVAPEAPAAPVGPEPEPAPEDVVVDVVKKLPEAASRRAKTEVRLQKPPAAAPFPPEAEITGPRLPDTPGPVRTVGGRTERLAPVAVPGAAPSPDAAAAPAGVDPAAVGQILERTIGGRTARRLPAAHEPPAAPLPPLTGAADGSGANAAIAAARLAAADASGTQAAQAQTAGNRWLVVGVLLVALVVLGSLAGLAVWQRSSAARADASAEPGSTTAAAGDHATATATTTATVAPGASTEPTAAPSETAVALPTPTASSHAAAAKTSTSTTKTPAAKRTSDLLFQ